MEHAFLPLKACGDAWWGLTTMRLLRKKQPPTCKLMEASMQACSKSNFDAFVGTCFFSSSPPLNLIEEQKERHSGLCCSKPRACKITHCRTPPTCQDVESEDTWLMSH